MGKGEVMLKIKFSKLKHILSEMRSVVVAFSGGVDSTFLLKAAYDILGDKVLAVTAVSGTYQKREHKEARDLADFIGARLKMIKTEELNDPKFINNPSERCYYCKKELFGRLKEIAKKEGYTNVIYGGTVSDKSDFRPGTNAAKELGVRAPLLEAGLGKEEIRILSKELGLPTWNKPAMACLASRFPYGEKITENKLARIEKAEEYIKRLGFSDVRVRIYDKTARIEINKEEIKDLVSDSAVKKIVKKLKNLGFNYITLDLEGYRTGSMNEVL